MWSAGSAFFPSVCLCPSLPPDIPHSPFTDEACSLLGHCVFVHVKFDLPPMRVLFTPSSHLHDLPFLLNNLSTLMQKEHFFCPVALNLLDLNLLQTKCKNRRRDLLPRLSARVCPVTSIHDPITTLSGVIIFLQETPA